MTRLLRSRLEKGREDDVPVMVCSRSSNR